MCAMYAGLFGHDTGKKEIYYEKLPTFFRYNARHCASVQLYFFDWSNLFTMLDPNGYFS